MKTPRVELHCHTSRSRGVTADTKEIIHYVHENEMNTVAILDNGGLGGVSEVRKIIKNYPPEEIKVIYGVEINMVDDTRGVLYPEMGQKLMHDAVILGIESSGRGYGSDEILEITAIKIQHGDIVGRYHTLVKNKVPLSKDMELITGITNEMLRNVYEIERVLPELVEFCKGCIIVSRYHKFTRAIFESYADELGIHLNHSWVDVVALAILLYPERGLENLDKVANYLGISMSRHKGVTDDVGDLAQVYIRLIKEATLIGMKTFSEANLRLCGNIEYIRSRPACSIVLLVRDMSGMKNLRRLVLDANTVYFKKRARIPKSEIKKRREGLLIGSAPIAGEIHKAIEEGCSLRQIEEMIDLYDYLELDLLSDRQIEDERNIDAKMYKESASSSGEINYKLIELGDKYGKLIVATSNVHYLHLGEEKRENEYQQENMDLHFRTTEEMLAETRKIDPERANEFVIKNTNEIKSKIQYYID